ncbi:zinc finger protein CO3-like isoform X2 [Dioscorea cayenensis subsp. rotundata]|uniref:Zinc finger protein CO3-like isoform X2 n=1 Tax=Dioscorea cayennensis subsp. rotundata TaxID=55577 RepID=A0AB40AQF3_DIOCR|nr:zinc finger protein CO3-like isoform X2 [Dioscorea cayenensis subsp. rotundata]
MYADTRLLPPLSQWNFQELHTSYHQLILPVSDDDFLSSFQSILPSNTSHMNPTVMEYDLGGEGDLFKAPEPIMGGEAVFAAVDPVTSAMSMISFGDEVISAETIKVAGMESIQNDHLSDFIYDCKKEFLAKSGIEDGFAELVNDVKEVHGVGAATEEEDHPVKRTRIVPEGPMQKSVSAECLSSMDWINNSCGVRPNFLSFEGLDFGAAFGMRRAYSEGDIQTLGSNNHSNGGGSSTSIVTKSEERREKLFRFWEKSKRNFGRKIKYACRKALADSQPRVRGRFAKTEDYEVSKPYK